MNWQRTPLAALTFLSALLILVGCARSRGDSEIDSSAPSLDSLRAVVLNLIDQPSCTSPEVCRTIAFGSKPCGGSWSYVAYSTQVTDSVRLSEVVAAFNDREKSLNQELGRASDCRMVTRPQVICQTGKCVTEQ